MDQAFRLLSSFSEPGDSFGLSDYWRLQDTMTAWYGAGKLEMTGHARGLAAGDDLSHHCETVQMTNNLDRIANV